MNKALFLVPLLCIFAQNSLAQNYPHVSPTNLCNQPANDDFWSLEPSKTVPGEYIFKYLNNLAKCSENLSSIGVTASDGFRVIMTVEIGVNENEDERITVIPVDPQYMAYPPELVIPDSSEVYEIKIIPGVS